MKFKYFAYPDLSFGYTLKNIQDEIDYILKNDSNIRMNLERFEILKYFNDNNLDLYKDNAFIEETVKYTRIIKKNIGIYFNKELDVEREVLILCEEAPDYIPTFLEVISYYKLDEKVNDFPQILLSIPDRHTSSILQNKYLIKKYPETITCKLLKNVKNAELLLNILMLNSELDNYYLPEEKYLTATLLNELLFQYVESEFPNLNYLNLIYQGKFTIKIDTKTRIIAKKKHDSLIQLMRTDDKFVGITTEIRVSITPLEKDIITINNYFQDNQYSTIILINEKWLNESLDFNSILQNMIYVFQLVDHRFRFSAIPKKESEGVFERAFGIKDNNAYFTSSTFKVLENIYGLMFTAYDLYLKKNKINILEVVKWYLSDYLREEYNISNFNLDLVDQNLPLRVLNNDLHTQFQRLIKMYHLYSEYEEINLKAVDIETHKSFDELKSLQDIKYVYLDNSELSTCSHYLFSDQSLLGALGRDNKFYISLENKEIKQTDIEKYLKPYIDLLIEKNIIKVEDGHLTVNHYKYHILKELFFNHTINYYWIFNKERKLIDEMIENKEIRTSNSLLSENEVDYFNYYLNDYFSNGVSLRNKYSHGSTGEFTEEEHKRNYTLLSYLIVLFILKINEEFNYKYDCNEKN